MTWRRWIFFGLLFMPLNPVAATDACSENVEQLFHLDEEACISQATAELVAGEHQIGGARLARILPKFSVNVFKAQGRLILAAHYLETLRRSDAIQEITLLRGEYERKAFKPDTLSPFFKTLWFYLNLQLDTAVGSNRLANTRAFGTSYITSDLKYPKPSVAARIITSYLNGYPVEIYDLLTAIADKRGASLDPGPAARLELATIFTMAARASLETDLRATELPLGRAEKFLPSAPWRLPLRSGDKDRYLRNAQYFDLWAEIALIRGMASEKGHDTVTALFWFQLSGLASKRGNGSEKEVVWSQTERRLSIRSDINAESDAAWIELAYGFRHAVPPLNVARWQVHLARFGYPRQLLVEASRVAINQIPLDEPGDWIDQAYFRRERIQWATEQLSADPSSVPPWLALLASRTDYPREASDALALLAASSEAKGDTATANTKLNDALKLAVHLRGRSAGGAWAQVLYNRVVAKQEGERDALVRSISNIEGNQYELDDVLAFWRLAEIFLEEKKFDLHLKLLIKLWTSSSNGTLLAPEVRLETQVKLAAGYLRVSDFETAQRLASELADEELAWRIRKRTRCAESAAIAALASEALGKPHVATKWARVALWYGSAPTTTLIETPLLSEHRPELSSIAARPIEGLGLDGSLVASDDNDPPISPMIMYASLKGAGRERIDSELKLIENANLDEDANSVLASIVALSNAGFEKEVTQRSQKLIQRYIAEVRAGRASLCAPLIMILEIRDHENYSPELGEFFDWATSSSTKKVCNSKQGLRFAALKLQAAIANGNSAIEPVLSLYDVIPMVRETGKLGDEHPLYSRISSLVSAFDVSNVEEMESLIVELVLEIFTPEVIFSKGADLLSGDFNLRHDAVEIAELRYLEGRVSYVEVTGQNAQSALHELRTFYSRIGLSGRMPEGLKTIARPHFLEDETSPFPSAVAKLTENWTETSTSTRKLEEALSVIGQSVHAEAELGWPKTNGWSNRTSEIEGATEILLDLTRKAVNTGQYPSALMLADAVINFVEEVPVLDGEPSWRALREVLRIAVLTNDDAVFLNRLKPVLANIEINRGGTGRYSAELLRLSRLWIDTAARQEVDAQIETLKERFLAGEIQFVSGREINGILHESLLRTFSVESPRRVLEILARLAGEGHNADRLEFLKETLDDVDSETLFHVVKLTQEGEHFSAQQILTEYVLAEPLLRQSGLILDKEDQRQSAIDNISAALRVCSTNKASLDALSVKKLSEALNGDELAFAQALVARGSKENAIRLLATSAERTADKVYKSKLFHALAVIQLYDRDWDDALTTFRKIWDLSNAPGMKGNSTLGQMKEITDGHMLLKQIAVAHMLLSLGQTEFAVELLRQAAQRQNLDLRARAELVYLKARVLLASSNPTEALDQLGLLREWWPGSAGEPFGSTFLFRGLLEERPLTKLTDLVDGSSAYPSSVLNHEWRSELGRMPDAAGNVPLSPLLFALEAANRIRLLGSELSPPQMNTVLDELRVGTRSQVAISYNRARLARASSDASALRRAIAFERVERASNRFIATDTLFALMSTRQIGDALELQAPCGNRPADDNEIRSTLADLIVRNTEVWDDQMSESNLKDRLSFHSAVPPSKLQLASDENAFVVVGQGSTIYKSVITNSKVIVYRTDTGGGTVEKLVDDARRSLKAAVGKTSVDRSALRAIGGLVLADIAEELNGSKVTIIAAGPLSSIPFHLLRFPSQNVGSEGAWLDERFRTVVVPGLDALYFPANARAGQRFKSLFAVADPGGLGTWEECSRSPYSLRNDSGFVERIRFRQFCSVSGTKRIAELFHQHINESSSEWLLSGAAATESALRNNPSFSKAEVVVFATHGLLSDEAQKVAGIAQPALIMSAPSEARPLDSHDGILTSDEIATLDISAEWVFLVACNSASSDGRYGGDALLGLADAFLSAGASGVIVSHWPLDTIITKALLKYALAEWDGGAIPMDVALTSAMQMMRNGKIFPGLAQTTELNWAPLVVVGR
ncbi:CHAT domain-containing protein [Rhizobium leguminosarum]|uniref:CHAT domain-containing protein n=1 Tax=Rhizobium leguminosarum TaxID=384 RepID=UPI0013BFFB7A|nr:CHAT domain-containing protein [Rhizobium leguminosarum]NEH58122.1 CHAT domain-containing protein [Rhizobium leguminosarum]